MQIPSRLFAVSVFLIAVCPAYGQLGRWTAHTSMRDVTGVTPAGSQVWVSTGGGVFFVDRETGEIGSLTAVEGLHGVSTGTIAHDAARSWVWVGYGDGVLDRIDMATLSVESFLDIARATQFSRRGVNRIVVRGDSLFVCTEFGVVVFDPDKGEVRDAYTRLGDLSAATPVNDVEFAPDETGQLTLWAATDEGLARAPLGSANLQDPSAWTTESLPVPVIRSVAYFRDRIYAGTDADLYERASDGSFLRLGVDAAEVSELEVSEGLLVGITRFQVVVIDGNATVSKFPVLASSFPGDIVLDGGELWLGTEGEGLLRLAVPPPGTRETQEPADAYLPEGPQFGVFGQLSAGSGGALWAAGVAGTPGFHRLDPSGSWTDYTSTFVDELQGRGSYTRIASGPDATAWAGSEGRGLAHVASDGSVLIVDESNSSLRAATGFPGFIVVGGVARGAEGELWVTTRGSPVPLHYRSPDGEWTALPPYVGEGLTAGATAYGKVYIDSFDQKWIILREEANFQLVKGLLVLDSGSDPTEPADDSFRFFGNRGGGGQGLPSRSVTAVVEDRDGLVWIGTQEGLAYFVNTGVVARDPSAIAIWPQRADRSEGTFLFLGLPVNDLAVDPANRLWVATNDGVRVVENVEDGFEEVLRLTADTSPLLSDVVLAVEVVADRGEVFLATDAGLVSVRIDAVSPAASVDDLFVYPNPVRIGEMSNPSVTVSGLVDRTDVSIVSALGETVARFSTRGGQSTWNLRDPGGELVPSGVYLVIAVAEEGGGTAYGKIAVIN